ncbi:hypothetical protein BDN71DRAFT_181563 [Pleurotus eryngii]|uniref:Uncharacterized protein n=1 Tax=Pleurotus eryngii TaxID=5323 RepID=A0A9P6A975_PLEER|nr:hypothetical protein BDN71DRAFT_181563 [Pleurotus eryngii]
MTDAAHIDATKAKLPSSTSGSITSFHPSPPGTPGDDPDGGHEVPIESGDMEEMMDDTSPTPSSPGHILASPQPARELGAIQVASSAAAKANPAITGDEDLVNALAEGKGKVQSASLEVGNHESLLSQRTLDSKIIELNIDEQAVSKGRPLGDIGLSHLPVTRGASSVVCSEVEIVQESTHCEIQECVSFVNISRIAVDGLIPLAVSPVQAPIHGARDGRSPSSLNPRQTWRYALS